MKTCPYCKAKTYCRSSYGTRFPCGTKYDPIKGITQGAPCATQVQYMKTQGAKS